MTWNNNSLSLLMVLWVDRSSDGHFSVGVSHMVAARYQLGCSHPKDQLSWIFKMATHMAGSWCWLSSGSSDGVLKCNMHICPSHVVWGSNSLETQFLKQVVQDWACQKDSDEASLYMSDSWKYLNVTSPSLYWSREVIEASLYFRDKN